MATLKDALAKKLTKKEMHHLVSSFDVVGSIAIIEIPPELEKKEKLIGEMLLSLNKNIRTVLKKTGIHKGKYRRQKLKVIAGEKTKTAEHREHNSRLRIDVEKVYFSSRSSTERKRIFQLVKPGEMVLVMFSGCAPYPITISRNSKAKEVYGIELNPAAHEFAVENARLNKTGNVNLIWGDVRSVIPALRKKRIKFDRVVMPLPKDAELFLKDALSVAKKGGTVHLYGFSSEDEINGKKENIIGICAENKRKCRIMSVNKCGHYSPRVYRICFDIRILS